MDPAVLRKIIEMIKMFIEKNIFKGKVGEAFRLSTCRLLECIAMVGIPLEDKEIEMFNVRVWICRHFWRIILRIH